MREERYDPGTRAGESGRPTRANGHGVTSGSVTHVDFQSRKVRKRAAGGWPVLVAKPLRPAESDESAHPTDEDMETAV